MKRKILYISFSILFVFIILIPSLGIFVYENDNKGENRQLFTWNKVKGFSTFDTYLLDNHALRDKMSNLSSYMYIHLLKESPNPALVVMAHKGWLYLGDSPNYGEVPAFSSAIGTYDIDTIKAKEVSNKINEIKKFCDSLQIQFYFAVAPSKEYTYPEYLNVTPNSKIRLQDYIIADTKERYNIRIIDLKKNLASNKKNYPVYYQRDTHWNKYGGYIATNTLTERIREDFAISLYKPEDYSIIKIERPKHSDLADILHINKIDEDYIIQLKDSSVIETSVIEKNDLYYTNFIMTNKSSQQSLKGIVLCDSFFEAIYDPFIQYFKEVHFIRTSTLNMNYISQLIKEKDRIDFIIFEKLDKNLYEIAIQ